jgi:hypothetical protein
VGEQCVALSREGVCQKLPEVAELDDGNLELLPLLQQPRCVGLKVEQLGGV